MPSNEPIAIIGMAGRFPGARDVRAFWSNLCDGTESIRTLSEEELLASGTSPELLSNPAHVRASATAEGLDHFDAQFFGVGAREAELMDPQLRLALETVWEALEDAGMDPSREGAEAGVFLAASLSSYLLNNLVPDRSLAERAGAERLLILNDKDFYPTTVSYRLNLRGPSVSVGTACSSSLVAAHLACQSLTARECRVAIAGGSSVHVPFGRGYLFNTDGIYSPDGHCRAFDAAANGTVGADGTAFIVLKRYSEAVCDRDRIYAVVLGSAINNDGGAKAGFTAPGVAGQAAVIRAALARAGVGSETIGYVEAHGTGTRLGDPIEFAALTEAFREDTRNTGYCALGALKPNVGHLDAAAGIAGLIKAALVVQNGLFPPSVSFVDPNPNLDLAGSPFFVNGKLRPWSAVDQARRAGVSAFGVGGTNAHVILEEAPQQVPKSPGRDSWIFPLSARNKSDFEVVARRLRGALPEIQELADMEFTLAKGRKHFQERRALVASSKGELSRLLDNAYPVQAPTAVPLLYFLAPPRSAVPAPLGSDLFRTENNFRRAVERCINLLNDRCSADQILRSFDASVNGTPSVAPQIRTLREFIFQYALGSMLKDWGARPDRIVGLDLGELSAAALSGSMNLRHAIALAITIDHEEPGTRSMLVKLSERELGAILPRHLPITAVYAPEICVVTGPADLLEQLHAVFARSGVPSKWLGYTPWTGTAASSQATDEHPTAREQTRIRIDEAMRRRGSAEVLWVELGTGRVLRALLRRNGLPHTAALPGLMARPHADESARTLQWLALLWERGVEVNWTSLLDGRGGRVCSLPTYPFQSRRYWLEPPTEAHLSTAPPTEAGRHAGPLQTLRGVPASDPGAVAPIAADRNGDHNIDWFYAPVWHPWTARPGDAPTHRRWLFFTNQDPSCVALEMALRQAGQSVVTVCPDNPAGRPARADYRIRVNDAEDYATLIDAVLGGGRIDGIIHAWTLGTANGLPMDKRVEAAQEDGIHSVVLLMQALGHRNLITPLRLCIVTNNTQEAVGGDLLRPEQASLKSVVKIIPQEYPNVQAIHLDMDSREDFDSANARRLATMVQSTTPERFLACRNSQWLRPDFAPVPAPLVDVTPRVRENGVYLITGGLGGVGLTLAEWLGRRTGARLILLGRTSLPPRSEWSRYEADDGPVGGRLRRILQIESSGAKVLVLAADLADSRRMREALREAEESFGKIVGVVHAAGVADLGGVIQRRSRRSIDRAMSAKVKGTAVLDALLADHALDFFVLCSAAGATVYNLKFGEIGYVAGNDFLNAYSHYLRTTRGAPAVTIAWTDWLGVGMTSEALKRIGQSQDSFDTVDHAWWERRRLTDAAIEYSAQVRPAAHWSFYGHRIAGRPTLPGAGLVELIASAFCMERRTPACEIRDLSLLLPVSVDEWQTAELRLSFEPRGATWPCKLTLGDDRFQQTTHATALVEPLVVSGGREALPLDDIRARCPRVLHIEPGESPLASDDAIHSTGIQLDDRWDVIRDVWLGVGEGLARVEVGAEFIEELREFQWHPALLDSALSFLNHAIAPAGAPYLPIGYERITLYGPLQPVLFSHGRWTTTSNRSGDLLRANFTIADARGAIVAEFVGITARKASAVRAKPDADLVSHRLEIGKTGALSTLGYRRFRISPPPPGHLEIEVLAAGLNFKDVLTALGLLDGGRPFGLECAGRVTRVGAGTMEWKAGDDVVAFGAEWTMPLACVPEAWVQPKPPALGFQEAATVPAAFTVAYHALLHEAKVRRGETILVHSACGGLGLAAIQIARRVGARIMATAGTESKQAYLREMGIECVSDSRRPGFSAVALEWTGGRGVDVVLNSLGGELLDEGLDSLAPRGRFIELGLRDLAQDRPIQLRRLAKGVQFLPVLPNSGDPTFVAAWREVVKLFLERQLQPLPYRTFEAARAANAFEEMAKGEHVGKLVVIPGGAYPPVSHGTRSTARAEMADAVSTLVQGMTPAQGTDAFSRALALDLPEVVVSIQDLNAMLRQQAIVSEYGHEAFWSARRQKADVSESRNIPVRPPREPGESVDVDRSLREIWRDLLGVTEIRPEDDFFDLGGDSLIAVRMIARVKEILDVDTTLARVFEASTFCAMSETIRSARAGSMAV